MKPNISIAKAHPSKTFTSMTFTSSSFASKIFLLCAVIAFVFSANVATATNYTWTGVTNSNWFSTNGQLGLQTGNWNPTGTLSGTDTVYFGSTTRLSPVINASPTIAGMVFTSGGSQYTFNGAGRTLTVSGSLVNQSGLMQTIGTTSSSPVLRLGDSGTNAIVDVGTGGMTFTSRLDSNVGNVLVRGSGDVVFNSANNNFAATLTGSAGNIYFNQAAVAVSGTANMVSGTGFFAVGQGNITSGPNAAVILTGTSGGMQFGQNLNFNGRVSSTFDIVSELSSNSIGTTNLTFGSSAYNSMDFYGPNGDGTALNDKFTADNNLTYGGTLALNLTNSVGEDLMADGTNWQLFSAKSISGSLSAMTFTGTGFYSSISGNPWHLATSTTNRFETGYGDGVWLSDWTTGGQRFIFSQNTGVLTVVPEPSTIVFAGIGVAMLGWHTWTRSRRRARMKALEDHVRRGDGVTGRA